MFARRGFDRGRVLALSPLLAGVLYTLWLAVFSYRYSTYVGDDLSAFWLLQTNSLGKFLLGHLGGQVVVLHRLLTLVVYRLAPMKFSLGVAVLASFHLAGAAYLYRSLELMAPSRVNVWLVAFYLTSVFIGVQLTWWSSGLTRFAYIAFANAAIFHYLRYSATGRKTDLVVVVVANLLALGFYSKAILVPAYCVALDLASGAPHKPTDRRERVLGYAAVASMLVAGVAYAAISRLVVPPAYRKLNTDVPYLFTFVGSCWQVFSSSLIDRALASEELASPWVGLPLLALVSYTSWRVRGALRAWALFAGLVTLNFLVVGISVRTLIWRTEMIVEYRHYFELMFLFVLFLGAVLHRIAVTKEGGWLAARDPRLTAAAGFALLGVHTVASTRVLFTLLRTQTVYSWMPDARSFLENLERDLKELETSDNRGPFVDDFFPPYLDILDFTFRHYSQLFVVLESNASFAPEKRARYRVAPDGHVVPIRGKGHGR